MLSATEIDDSQEDSGTHLATSLAHMRLLAGVYARMHSQSAALNELFATAGVIAHVRSDATVDTF